MIRGLYTASAGMQVEQLRQEAISNNLANANTSGFRRDLALMQARATMNISQMDPGNTQGNTTTAVGPLGTGVEINRMVKDFSQGDVRKTDIPYDLALTGKGFMTVQDAKGKTLYSRDGQFTRTGEGFLEDKVGNKLMGENGPIVVNGKLQVTTDGNVLIDGKFSDRLQLRSFSNPDTQLEKQGDTMFTSVDPAAATASSGVEVQQGALESANVNSVQEMVDMIACMRQYEANSKALQAADETLGHAVNDIAK